jgi:hypothetical protein
MENIIRKENPTFLRCYELEKRGRCFLNVTTESYEKNGNQD